MIFPTAGDVPRPVLLKESTRLFAWESMHGKYGDDAMNHPFLPVDGIPDFDAMSDVRRQDAAIRLIASEAPLRFCEGERVHGAATLGGAIRHCIPVARNGEPIMTSVSHLTICFEDVLRYGLEDAEKRIEKKLAEPLSPREREFEESLKNVTESIRIYHRRYEPLVAERDPAHLDAFRHVPMKPARNFYEAVQTIWFIFSFVRLCGNWPGIGRIDALLGPYLEKDLRDGTLTLEEAREILASFFIKGCEWIQSDTRPASGDAQHYQNIILSGVDAEDRIIENEVTYLVLDIIEELGISDFPVSVRIGRRTGEKLLRRVAGVMKHGGGVVAVYNEDLVIDAMVKAGYEEKIARGFANDGCWEVQVPGETDFIYYPFDALSLFQQQTLQNNTRTFDSYEALYAQYQADLRKEVKRVYDCGILPMYRPDGSLKEQGPCSVVSLFERDCIGRARSYWEGGPNYKVRSPHIGGIADVVNSLYAIKKLVFDDRVVSFEELLKALRENWEGAEPLRLIAKNRYVYYGNDSDEADAVMARLVADFAAFCAEQEPRMPIRFPAGISTFGRQIEWAKNRTATPFGAKKGDILASNVSATPNTDQAGATALIRSLCKADLSAVSCGAALDIKILPQVLKGKEGTEALAALLRGFVQLGGFFVQIDSVDVQTLYEAQKDPQSYKTLSVRVSGWNARFVTLNRDWQQMIIERTAQGGM